MPTPTSRVLQLLELLQSADIRSLGELADRLGVNERTVRRYVQDLLDLGIPVESVRGRYGGYRLTAGLRPPPLILSNEEAVAVVLGLAHVQGGAEVAATAARKAMSKIRRSLPAESARRLDTLLETAVFSVSAQAGVPDADILLTIALSVKERSILEVRYRNADGTPSRRTVHPFDLVVHSGRWYLVAFDSDQQQERTFRVDRISTARTLPGVFTPPPAGDAVSRLVSGFANADYRWRVELRIRATEDHIRTHLPASVATLQPLTDLHAESTAVWHRADIRAKRLDWIPPVIAALDCEVIIDQPEELVLLIRSTAERLLRISTASSQKRRSQADQ